MNDWLIFDTSILIHQLRANLYDRQIAQVEGIIRYSSVVLAELWRGAKDLTEIRFIQEEQNNHRILTPTENNWLESGRILSKMRKDRGFEPAKLRDLHFDILIALTARNHGARLITNNRADFELIRKYRDFRLEVW